MTVKEEFGRKLLVRYSPEEGSPWIVWPLTSELPTLTTLKFLYQERMNSKGKNGNTVLFCGIWFHAIHFGELRWDCISGFGAMKLINESEKLQ